MAQQKIVTPEECCEILQKDLQTKDFEILEYEEKSVSEEVSGIMAGHYRLQIKVKINNKPIIKKYFIKRMLSKFEIQNQMIKQQGAYDKEKFTYDFLTELSKIEPKYSTDYIPKCFLTVKDEKFILEDMGEEGYLANKLGNYMLDVPHLKVALEKLARFHASSIIYEHKKSLEIGAKYKLSDEYSQYFKDSLYRQNEDNYLGNKVHEVSVKAILALIDIVQVYSEDEKEDLKSKVLKQADNVFEMVKESKKFYNVINHGDLWCNNVLFKYENDNIVDCKLIDFQAIRYTVPSHDFLFLVYASLDSDLINKHQEELQKLYYNSLKNYLEVFNIDINNYVPYEEFLQSMEYILPFIILQRAGFATLYILGIDLSLEKDAEKFKTFMYENRTDISIEMYEKNDGFKEIIHIAFRDLKHL